MECRISGIFSKVFSNRFDFKSRTEREMNHVTFRPVPSRPTWTETIQDGGPFFSGATRGFQPNSPLTSSSNCLHQAAFWSSGSGAGGSGGLINKPFNVCTTNVTVPIVPPIAPSHPMNAGGAGITSTSICSGSGTGRGAGDASGSGSGTAIARGARWHQTCSRNQ